MRSRRHWPSGMSFCGGLLQKEFGNVDWVEFYGRRMDVAALKKVTMIKGRKRSFIYDFYG